jgi:hypothetical protein
MTSDIILDILRALIVASVLAFMALAIARKSGMTTGIGTRLNRTFDGIPRRISPTACVPIAARNFIPEPETKNRPLYKHRHAAELGDPYKAFRK